MSVLPPDEAPEGLMIRAGGHVTRLKWHRLRRSLQDPEFGTEVMLAGFALGASMELDLNIRGDGGFVVLHDARLERETSGAGWVAAQSRAELAGLTYRQSGQPLILSETLALMLPAAHPDTLLQFDLKNDLPTIGARGIDHLAELFGKSASPIIFSGASAPLIRALAERLPHLPRGIDPTDRLAGILRGKGVAAAEAALRAELRCGTDPDTCYLSWQLLRAARQRGCDLVALCRAEGVRVDAWTFTPARPALGFSAAEWADFRELIAQRPDQITTDESRATEAAYRARAGGGAGGGAGGEPAAGAHSPGLVP